MNYKGITVQYSHNTSSAGPVSQNATLALREACEGWRSDAEVGNTRGLGFEAHKQLYHLVVAGGGCDVQRAQARAGAKIDVWEIVEV